MLSRQNKALLSQTNGIFLYYETALIEFVCRHSIAEGKKVLTKGAKQQQDQLGDRLGDVRTAKLHAGGVFGGCDDRRQQRQRKR